MLSHTAQVWLTWCLPLSVGPFERPSGMIRISWIHGYFEFALMHTMLNTMPQKSSHFAIWNATRHPSKCRKDYLVVLVKAALEALLELD